MSTSEQFALTGAANPDRQSKRHLWFSLIGILCRHKLRYYTGAGSPGICSIRVRSHKQRNKGTTNAI